MAAILRVKRKITDTPLETLVIACKRPKTEVSLSDNPPVETVVQLAATLTDPTEDVTKHVAKILENHKTGIKRVSDSNYPANISGKIPKWIDERYKVTDCQSLDTLTDTEFKDTNMMLIDVEDCRDWNIHPTESDQQSGRIQEDLEDYVYDLYCAQTSNNIWFESDNISVRRPDCSDIIDFEDEDDSSDSNAESNWKNDYPDADPDRSSKSSFNEDYLDISDNKSENEFTGIRRTEYGYEIIYRNKDDSSDSDLWEESLSDKEEIVDEISCNEETSDDERTENIYIHKN